MMIRLPYSRDNMSSHPAIYQPDQRSPSDRCGVKLRFSDGAPGAQAQGLEAPLILGVEGKLIGLIASLYHTDDLAASVDGDADKRRCCEACHGSQFLYRDG